MSQYTVLGGNFPFFHKLFDGGKYSACCFHIILHWIDSDNCVPTAKRQSFLGWGHNSVNAVCRVVWLIAESQCAWHSNSGITVSLINDFLCRIHEVHVWHQFCHTGNHFTGQAAAKLLQTLIISITVQNIFPQFRNSPVLNFVIHRGIETIVNNTCYLIFIIRYYGIVVDILQSKIA